MIRHGNTMSKCDIQKRLVEAMRAKIKDLVAQGHIAR
jgi:hypothetical protein